MPLQPILPIWGGLNTANSPSSTGLVDPVTNQQYNTGGLNVGDYFDLTEKEANTVSNTNVGLCHAGRYRFVQLDSGATAANVKTGTMGYLRAGGGIGRVASVVITNAGTGATAGTYTISATAGSGGGSGAVIQAIVGSGGTITSVAILNSGSGYNSVPTFSLTATGTTAGAVAAQLDISANVVTSYDQAGVTGIAVRPVAFLNALNATTPGNFTFIQELGVATLLGNAAFGGAATVGGVIQPKAAGGGTVEAPASATAVLNTTIGLAIDLPVVSNLFKVQLGYACTVVQD